MVSPWMQHGSILKHLGDVGGSNTAKTRRYVGVHRARKNSATAQIHPQLSEIAQGLEYLHSQNIIHGDLRGVSNSFSKCQ